MGQKRDGRCNLRRHQKRSYLLPMYRRRRRPATHPALPSLDRSALNIVPLKPCRSSWHLSDRWTVGTDALSFKSPSLPPFIPLLPLLFSLVLQLMRPFRHLKTPPPSPPLPHELPYIAADLNSAPRRPPPPPTPSAHAFEGEQPLGRGSEICRKERISPVSFFRLIVRRHDSASAVFSHPIPPLRSNEEAMKAD